MHPSVLFLRPRPQPSCTATHSPSHPRNITWHATQGRSMIPALFIPSVLAIRLLPFPISPLGPLSVTYIRSFHFQRDDRAIKWTANDRHSGTSPLAVSPPWECERQLNQSCYLPYTARKQCRPTNWVSFFTGALISGWLLYVDALMVKCVFVYVYYEKGPVVCVSLCKLAEGIYPITYFFRFWCYLCFQCFYWLFPSK